MCDPRYKRSKQCATRAHPRLAAGIGIYRPHGWRRRGRPGSRQDGPAPQVHPPGDGRPLLRGPGSEDQARGAHGAGECGRRIRARGGDAGAAKPIARPSLTASAMPWTIPAAPAAGAAPTSARSPLESAASRLEYLRALDTSLESARLAYWAQYGIPAAPPPVPAPGAVPYPYTQGPPSQRASMPGMHSLPGSARVGPLQSPLHSSRELAMAPPPP